ncbi:DUF6873 family GME fold protein [Candidatus Omnitrophota bacterium]
MRLIHSAGIPKPYLSGLQGLLPGLTAIPLPPSRDVYPSIAAHPDIFLFVLDNSTLISSRSLPKGAEDSLKRSGVNLVASQTVAHGKYPETAPLNAVRVGKYIFHNTQFTDTAIRDLAEERGLELVHVDQGYARCSVIPVGEGSMITCDEGIAGEAERSGLDVERVSTGGVSLPGERHGFIGGASGIMPDGAVVFLGDIRRHADHQRIDAFLKMHGVDYKYLPDLPLFDAGSLIFF